MWKLLILLIFISLNLSAKLLELNCLEGEDNDVYIRNDGYELRLTKSRLGDGCDFRLSPKKEKTFDYRSYSFHPDGSFMNFVSFDSQVDSDRLSRTTGSSVYQFYPQKQKHKIYRDDVTGELKIEMINGLEIYIDPKTGLIDEEKTTDIKVDQTEIIANRPALKMTSPKNSMIHIPYRTGGDPTVDRYKKVKVYNDGHNCNITSHKLYRYEVSCRSTGHCKCNGDTEKICYLKSNELDGYSYSDINAAKLLSLDTNEIENELPSNCKGESEVADKVIHKVTHKKLKPLKKIVEIKSTVSDDEDTTPVASTDEEIDAIPVEDTDEGLVMNIEDTEEVADTTLESSDKKRCLDIIKDFFNSTRNKDLINEYIQIQGKITLHRIAWTLLKTSDDNTNNIEETIKKLLLKRNPVLHEEFVKTGMKTRNERLLSVMEELKEVSGQYKEGHEAYTLKYSDLKMMNMLVKAEEVHGRSARSGVMDFVSIIKNSLKTRLNKKEENRKYMSKILDRLIAKKEKLNQSFEALLAQEGCNKGRDISSCAGVDEKLDIEKALDQYGDVIDAVYAEQFEKEEELKNNFKWGTYWLHVTK